jgi:hypothetical protein
LTWLPPPVPDSEIRDTPLEEWCAGVDQLLQDLETSPAENVREEDR